MTTSGKNRFEMDSTTMNPPIGEYRSINIAPINRTLGANVSQAKIATGVVISGQYRRNPNGGGAVFVTMDASALPRKLAVERLNAEMQGSTLANTTASPRKPRA